MFLVSEITSGTILYDRRTGDELVVDNVEFLSFKYSATGVIKREPFSQTEVEARFQIVDPGEIMFRADPGTDGFLSILALTQGGRTMCQFDKAWL